MDPSADPRRIRGPRGCHAGSGPDGELVTGTGGNEVLHPEIVLGFHGLCLVKPVHDDDWYMGSLYEDGSIDCWGAYDDLYEALRGL